ncbi:MAG TPA: hypothetical protein PLD84_03300 [Chitinophagales bacterium]|nr:hypothetical protein [Chitinophagales bacterium]
MGADNHKVFPEEHFPVFRQLMSQLVEKVLLLPLQPIEYPQAHRIKLAFEDSIGNSLSGKVLREMVNAAARNENTIKKPRLSTLNMIAKFVLGRYEPGNTLKEAQDQANYWYEYLNKYQHLIVLGSDSEFKNNEQSKDQVDKIQVIIEDIPFTEKKDVILLNDVQQEKKPEAPFRNVSDLNRKLLEGCLIGGFLVGICNTLLVIFFPASLNGYPDVAKEDFIKLIPGISSSNIGAGILFGLVCGYFGRPPVSNLADQIVSRKEKIWIAVLSFLILVPFKQAASRGSGQLPAPMGFPDFETISYYLTCTIGIICLLRILRSHDKISFLERVKYALSITLKIAVPLVLIYLIFHFVIAGSDFHLKTYPNEGLVLFKFQYSHPERIILVLTMAFSSVLILLSTRNFYLKPLSKSD